MLHFQQVSCLDSMIIGFILFLGLSKIKENITATILNADVFFMDNACLSDNFTNLTILLLLHMNRFNMKIK